jgi:hypothetical protein
VRATRISQSYTVPLASAPHQRPEPRWANIATGEARTGAKLAPVGPPASNDKCHCQDGDDEHQQTENLFRIHGDLAFHAADNLTAWATLVCAFRHTWQRQCGYRSRGTDKEPHLPRLNPPSSIPSWQLHVSVVGLPYYEH